MRAHQTTAAKLIVCSINTTLTSRGTAPRLPDVGTEAHFPERKQPTRYRYDNRYRQRSIGTRGDEIVEVVLRAPDVHNERTRELLRELAHVQTEDVRSDIWSKVQAPAA